MKQSFDTREVMRNLGLAPSTASVVANLLSGNLNPDRCRSIEAWPMKQFGDLPPQPLKILCALSELLEGREDKPGRIGEACMFVDMHDYDIPTVIWDLQWDKFVIDSINEYMRKR